MARKKPKWDPEYYPWDRQPDESKPAHEAFKAYLATEEMFNGKRSISALARNISKSRHLMVDWSARHNWQERAAAYDKYMDDRDREAMIKERKKAIRRHAALGRNMQKLGNEAAKLQEGKLDEMTVRDLINLLVQGVTIERNAMNDGLTDSDRSTDNRGTETRSIIISFAGREDPDEEKAVQDDDGERDTV